MEIYVIEIYHWGTTSRVGITTDIKQALKMQRQYSPNFMPCIKKYTLTQGEYLDFGSDECEEIEV